MEDLLQSEIRERCRLALPDGLRDLLCDISREVLRAQPPDLYQFIADYLAALLLTRAIMTIACRVCRDVCQCSCQPELETELRNIGIEGQDLETAKNVVMEYFDNGEVKEGNLLMKLFRETDITEDMLPSVQEAVRLAFMKHHLVAQSRLKVKSEANERGKKAAERTLKVYGLTHDEDIREKAAVTIQAGFRGFLARSYLRKVLTNVKAKITQIKESNNDKVIERECARPGTSKLSRSVCRLSSASLAGSFLQLPKYIPYSAHNITSYAEYDEHETERINIDYKEDDHKSDKGRKIKFIEHHTLQNIDSRSIENEENQVEEEIVEENTQSDVASDIDENVMGETSFAENDEQEIIDEENKHPPSIEDTVDNIEENLVQGKGFSDYETVADDHENEYSDDEMKEQQGFSDELVIRSENDMIEETELNNKVNRSSKHQLSIIDEETIKIRDDNETQILRF